MQGFPNQILPNSHSAIDLVKGVGQRRKKMRKTIPDMTMSRTGSLTTRWRMMEERQGKNNEGENSQQKTRRREWKSHEEGALPCGEQW
jgi:hypothetical protein